MALFKAKNNYQYRFRITEPFSSLFYARTHCLVTIPILRSRFNFIFFDLYLSAEFFDYISFYRDFNGFSSFAYHFCIGCLVEKGVAIHLASIYVVFHLSP